MKYIILLLLLLPLVNANLTQIHNIKFVDFNGSIEDKFYFATINEERNLTFNLSECKDICLNNVVMNYTPKFQAFLYAVLTAVGLTSLCIIGFLIKNEYLALYSVILALVSYSIGALILIF